MYVYILTIKVKRICIYFDNKGKTYMYVYILTIKIQLRTHEDKGNKHTPVSQDKRTVEKFFLREKGFQGKFERTDRVQYRVMYFTCPHSRNTSVLVLYKNLSDKIHFRQMI